MGQINTSNVTDYETLEEFNKNKLINDNNDDTNTMDIDDSNSSKKADDISYEVYEKFWKLQSFFSDENKTFESVQKYKDFRGYHYYYYFYYYYY